MTTGGASLLSAQQEEEARWRGFDREWQGIKATVIAYRRRDVAFLQQFINDSSAEIGELKRRLAEPAASAPESDDEALYWNHLRERRDLLLTMLKGIQW